MSYPLSWPPWPISSIGLGTHQTTTGDKLMFPLKIQIRLEIQDIFDLGKPVTLRQLCAGLESQMSAKPTEVLPYVITAIADMIEENKICQFVSEFEDPLNYQWVLSTDPRPKPRTDLPE